MSKQIIRFPDHSIKSGTVFDGNELKGKQGERCIRYYCVTTKKILFMR